MAANGRERKGPREHRRPREPPDRKRRKGRPSSIHWHRLWRPPPSHGPGSGQGKGARSGAISAPQVRIQAVGSPETPPQARRDHQPPLAAPTVAGNGNRQRRRKGRLEERRKEEKKRKEKEKEKGKKEKEKEKKGKKERKFGKISSVPV